nr:unnamed protein product [Spirometra erinaceieuropaei]
MINDAVPSTSSVYMDDASYEESPGSPPNTKAPVTEKDTNHSDQQLKTVKRLIFSEYDMNEHELLPESWIKSLPPKECDENFLSPEAVRSYCSRLFELKEEETIVFRSHGERMRYLKSKRKATSMLSPLTTAKESGLIRYQVPVTDGCPTRRQPRDIRGIPLFRGFNGDVYQPVYRRVVCASSSRYPSSSPPTHFNDNAKL